jgi:ABC-type oligopeptide transport system substrate-binding subunit
MRQAAKLLADAGWTQKGGALVDAKGQPFEMEFLIVDS